MNWFAKAEDLVLGYGNHVAMTASSFTLPAEAVVAIIGPNGSGKSTLLHALAGVLKPRSGSLRIADLPAVGNRISYVMQSVQYPEGTPITVRETVAMGRYAQLGWFRPMKRHDRAQVTEAMERLEITDLAKRHLSELSGGQRQRVYVAQGLAQGHEVLLLDEPLTGLDLPSARKIDKIIHDEREHGHTVVLTTHDLDEARAADHVVLMSGRVVANGTPEAVLTRRNLELAYGLGALHDHDHDRKHGSGLFLDDPAHPEVD
ncbi:MAG: metal ABC transporter ATP-binding protein [Propionibacterium sp.]|nr:metal ABC transporter ATP-binding protein [Propionibacterium sp.]